MKTVTAHTPRLSPSGLDYEYDMILKLSDGAHIPYARMKCISESPRT